MNINNAFDYATQLEKLLAVKLKQDDTVIYALDEHAIPVKLDEIPHGYSSESKIRLRKETATNVRIIRELLVEAFEFLIPLSKRLEDLVFSMKHSEHGYYYFEAWR